MADILIRNVPADQLKKLEDHAALLGLSRADYVRRQLLQEAQRVTAHVSVADLGALSNLVGDLLDDAVMRDAWS